MGGVVCVTSLTRARAKGRELSWSDWGIQNFFIIIAGQIIATGYRRLVTLKWWFSKGIPPKIPLIQVWELYSKL